MAQATSGLIGDWLRLWREVMARAADCTDCAVLLPLGSQGLMRLILDNNRRCRLEPGDNENHSHALPKQGTVKSCEQARIASRFAVLLNM